MQKADMLVYLGAIPFFPVVSSRATCPPKNNDDPPLMIHINDKEMILLADNKDFGLDWTRSLSRKESSSSSPRDTVARYTPEVVVVYVGEFQGIRVQIGGGNVRMMRIIMFHENIVYDRVIQPRFWGQ
jgi:hypothetical protein